MMTTNTQSVNVKRVELIEKLKSGLELHRKDYLEAIEDYKKLTLVYLTESLKRVQSGEIVAIKFITPVPINREADYIDVINMMEYSVDEHINLDKTMFKAYFFNEWSWARDFSSLMGSMKASLSASASL